MRGGGTLCVPAYDSVTPYQSKGIQTAAVHVSRSVLLAHHYVILGNNHEGLPRPSHIPAKTLCLWSNEVFYTVRPLPSYLAIIGTKS